MLFRSAEEVSETLCLRGLEAGAQYDVREINCGNSCHAELPAGSVSGRDLMEKGLAVRLVGKYDSAAFEIRRR